LSGFLAFLDVLLSLRSDLTRDFHVLFHNPTESLLKAWRKLLFFVAPVFFLRLVFLGAPVEILIYNQ
jgi:hypothetical protein